MMFSTVRSAGSVDIRTIQLMLGHADIKETQRYLNITDEELRKAMTGVWERRRQLRVSHERASMGTDTRCARLLLSTHGTTSYFESAR